MPYVKVYVNDYVILERRRVFVKFLDILTNASKCHIDKRVKIATSVGGAGVLGDGTPHNKGELDVQGSLDITDEAYEDFFAGREAFMRLLGEPLFLETFDLPNFVFLVLKTVSAYATIA